MKRILILIYSLVAIQFTYGQKQIHVVDSLTGKGLPFATVECFEKKWGLYTDSAGFATIPENMLEEKHKVSYVGYQPKEISFTKTNSIALNRLPQKLEDVTVVSCKETNIEKLEVKETKGSTFLGFMPNSNGASWAIYVPNSTSKHGILKTLGYDASGISKVEKINAPIRIRFFEFDSITKLPSIELNFEDIIIAPKKRQYVVHDLSRYNIIVPENGIIVSFEIFDAGEEYHYTRLLSMQDGSKKVFNYYGWFIKSSEDDKIIGFRRKPGSEWERISNFMGKKNSVGPAVSLEIKVCK